MTALPWQERARRRGAGMHLFRPPEEAATTVGWHLIMTHEGPMTLQWRPGIDVWRNADGQRWTAETAGELRWRYVRPAGEEAA